jgi:hypothetical protein
MDMSLLDVSTMRVTRVPHRDYAGHTMADSLLPRCTTSREQVHQFTVAIEMVGSYHQESAVRLKAKRAARELRELWALMGIEIRLLPGEPAEAADGLVADGEGAAEDGIADGEDQEQAALEGVCSHG